MPSLIDEYNARVAAHMITADPAQIAILPEFERIREGLDARASSWWRFGRKASGTHGLYVWGGVGRGKSMLMDLLVENVEAPKRRVHFHSFMQWAHGEIDRYRKAGQADPVAKLVKDIAGDVRLLALDEMQITDIADAMIVGRIFEGIMDEGVTVVTTSNRPPRDLYKQGLNRQLFLPFIDMLEREMAVVHMQAAQDYRQGRLVGQQTYFTPVNAAACAGLDAIWQKLAGGPGDALHLAVKNRDVLIPEFRNGVARAGFFDLCGQPLGPADYMALAEEVRVLMLDGIPLLGRNNFNEAKRFVTLIDVVYEAKLGFVCSAAAEPEMLYVEGAGAFEFQRTASRLREMQSVEWQKHIGEV